MGMNRYIAFGSNTTKTEADVSENIHITIEKQQRSIARELDQELHAQCYTLQQNAYNQTTAAPISLAIDDNRMEKLINHSKSIVASATKLSNTSICKIKTICRYLNERELKDLCDEQFVQQQQEILQRFKINNMYVLTRAQKRKLEEQKQQQQREERKESKEEENLWHEVKENIDNFNDTIAIQSHVYQTLWGCT